jgi:outer membrane lipoprotein-sorting protein
MADKLLSLDSYQGELIQQGLLPEAPGMPVVENVLYVKPWRVRAEVTAPANLKGSLFLYDGNRMVMWWPHELFGISVTGLPHPSREEVVAAVKNEVKDALDHYAFSLTPDQEVAGYSTSRWQVLPLRHEPYRMKHTSWVYDRYALPLKMAFQEDGKSWYSYEFRHITFGVPVTPDAFNFTFPENAVVFKWDMQSAGISLEEARLKMNFTIMQPTWLPADHHLQKIVPGESCLPMIAFQYSHGASILTLTEMRNWVPLPRFGKAVTIGKHTGWLYFAGSYSVLSWSSNNTQLTLVGNLSFPQIIRIAQSVR